LISALSILPFIDDPATGIAKIHSVIADTKISGYQLRDLAPALGHCRCGEALPVLRELASSEVQFKSMEDSWVNAVAALGNTEAGQLLLSFVDPSIPGLAFEAKLEREDIITARLVELASRDEEIERRLLGLCSVHLPARKRALLARVVGSIANEEALVEALDLIDDSVTPAIPYELYRSIESIFIEKRSYGNDSNAYTQASRSANRVRNQLFEMSRHDGRRQKSAATLLGQIELWRLEYGRPFDEPRSLEVEYESSWPTVPANQLQPDRVAGGP